MLAAHDYEVRLLGQRRAANAGAVDRKMNARLIKMLPQDIMLNIIEGHFQAPDPKKFQIPY